MSLTFRLRSNPFFTIFTVRMLFRYRSLNFLATGLVSIVFFMFSSEMGKSFSENFSFAENFAFLYLFSLNFALIRFTKKCINIAKICDNSRFFSEISLSCFSHFLRDRIMRKFVFVNIKNT